MPLKSFIITQKKTQADYGLLRPYGNLEQESRNHRRIALLANRCAKGDIYISGDAPHHVRRDIVNANFNYLTYRMN